MNENRLPIDNHRLARGVARPRQLGYRRWVLTSLLAWVLAACGGAQPGAQQSTAAPVLTAAPQATAGPTRLPTPGPNEFANPVIDVDFPDPDVLKVGDTYFAYATESGSVTIQTAKSNDLVSWNMIGNALIVMPDWSKPGFTWAPEVTTWDGGKTFAMYFTARDVPSNKQCIGAATSAKPEGPFQPAGDKPLICQTDIGGSIDPSSFVDEDGARYLLWKNDGNCCGSKVNIYIQKVAADGLALEGEPAKLITNDQRWEGQLVEAPTLWKHNGKYYLFYSANSYAGVDYAIGWAVADTPFGPYAKPSKTPLLATDMNKPGGPIGPGGQDVVLDKDGETWLFYHSWDSTATYRRIMIDRLVWEGDTPVVKGPIRGPQPKP